MNKTFFLTISLFLVVSSPTFAQESLAEESSDADPLKTHIFGTFLLSTTLGYKPHVGDFAGPQKDLTVMVGVGYLFTEALALELDLGPTFAPGGYVAFSLVPGFLWLFHPNFYTALRFIVPVHPEVNFAFFPGIGAAYPFECGLTPFIEAHVFSFVGRGEPDFGIALDIGITYLF